MTDRRSHWDIDLVEGVGRRLIPRYRSIGYCTDAERHRIYTLIEFVEDWQDRTQQARAMSMTDNEAAIAQVREVCDKDSFWINHAKTGGWGKALTVAQVLAALEGGSDE